ncbi:MAG: NAD(P)H-dependent oxidoreductase subunit E [Oscillospiraceae bacterium]|nr:NAD(P)H-dependent oxidoreductase subunit E [Oscillospiraceae bacterium]
MLKKISTLPFNSTPEQNARLDAVIAESGGEKANLMHVMQQAQGIYGYLPFEVQAKIADGMNIPLEHIYGVSTFYAQFALAPKGKYNVMVCMGTACYVRGAQEILDKVQAELGIGNDECTEDGLFSIEPCRCIGACGLAPVMMINDDVYGNLVPSQIPEILAKYRSE